MYNRCNTSRAIAFAFCLGFTAVGVRWAAAQAAPKLPTDPHLPSTVVQEPTPEASEQKPSPDASPITGAKPGAVHKARQVVQGQDKAANEPEEMKIVQIYRGDGHFDVTLAERLRPVLEKTFGVSPANVVSDVVRSMFGQNEGQKNSPNQNGVTNTGKP